MMDIFMYYRKKDHIGFTLIELLVVIAVIAILAAIALPNFLQAQTRSKVSRVMSELRTVGMALEAYYIDNNHYPPDYQYSALNPIYQSFLPRLIPLSTPIAYITLIPDDIFAIKSVTGNKTWDGPYRIPIITGPLVRPFPFDYACRIDVNGSLEDVNVWANIGENPNSILWALKSVGPDQDSVLLGFPGSVRYDPTNGTISNGDIYYTGPGKGIDGPQK
jgi:type II secretion system protein G